MMHNDDAKNADTWLQIVGMGLATGAPAGTK
jgi:hypothetical protein